MRPAPGESPWTEEPGGLQSIVSQSLSRQAIFYCIYISILSSLSVDEHLGCFHVSVLVHSAAVNIGVHVFLSYNVCPSQIYAQGWNC